VLRFGLGSAHQLVGELPGGGHELVQSFTIEPRDGDRVGQEPSCTPVTSTR
jgi:hypothetical protein